MEKQNTSNELDLVFLCDCTGSMGSYISIAQANITKIMEKIQASEKRDVQFAVIGYRDHTDDYVTKVFPFTKSVNKAKEYVAQLSASGGGDTPEAVASAIHDLLDLPYRKTATKIVVIVADAPPHGLSSQTTDSYPGGDPKGHDPLVDTFALAERGIIIYSVGCEPTLSSSRYARDFFQALAILTGGRYIALGNALILPDIIIGGAEEEIALEKLSKALEEEKVLVQKQAECEKVTLSEEQMYAQVTERLQAKGVDLPTLNIDKIEEGGDDIALKISKCKTLPEAKKMLDALLGGGQPQYAGTPFSFHSAHPSAYSPSSSSFSAPNPYLEESRGSTPSFGAPPTSSYASQAAYVTSAPVSYEQVSRVLNRNTNRK